MVARALARVGGGLRALAGRNARAPLKRRLWLPGQMALLASTAKRKVYRAPNQAMGKTEAGAAETWFRLSKTHPFRPELNRPRRVRGVVLSPTWEQSQVAQERLWRLCDRDLLAPGCVYDEKKGAFLGKYPKMRLKDGSQVVFKSGRGDTLSLAGLTVDFGWVDEPPPTMRVYGELQKRVLKTNGDIYMTFTPVNAPVEWLQKRCEEGAIEDLHFRMTPENLTPVGARRPLRLLDGTLMDQAFIDATIRDTLPHEVPVVCHGEWAMLENDATFSRSFRPSGTYGHVTETLPRVEVDLYLGMDFGIHRHTCVGLLIAVERNPADPDNPRVWVVDEYVNDGDTTEDDDALAVLLMLERHGFTWRQLTAAYGDRAHQGHAKSGAPARKSVERMNAALARSPRAAHHGIRGGPTPSMKVAKRKSAANLPGAPAFGCTLLHRWMLRDDHFHIHPRCERLILSLGRFRLRGGDAAWAHAVDALRYGLRDHLYRRKTLDYLPEVRWAS